MVHLDQSCRDVPVPNAEIHPARLTTCPVDGDSGSAVASIPFVSIDMHRAERTLGIAGQVLLVCGGHILERQDRNYRCAKPTSPRAYDVQIWLSLWRSEFYPALSEAQFKQAPALSPYILVKKAKRLPVDVEGNFRTHLLTILKDCTEGRPASLICMSHIREQFSGERARFEVNP